MPLKRNIVNSAILFLAEMAPEWHPNPSSVTSNLPGSTTSKSKRCQTLCLCIYKCKEHVLATEIYYAASTSRHKIEFCGPQDHSRYPDLKRKSVLWTECTFKTDQGKLWESGAPGLKRGSREITQPASRVKICGGTGLRSYAFPACLKLKSVSHFKCAKLKTR